MSNISLNYPLGLDARAYMVAAQAIQQNQNPYDVNSIQSQYAPGDIPGPGYIYPPLLAILLMPFIQDNLFTAAYIGIYFALISTILLTIYLSSKIGWLYAVVAVLFFPETWHSIYIGQVNALIALLSSMAVFSLLLGKDFRAGSLIALGTLIKVVPGICIYPLIRTKNYKVCIAFAFTILACIVICLPIVSANMWFIGLVSALASPIIVPDLISWPGIISYRFGIQAEFISYTVFVLLLVLTLVRTSTVPLRYALIALIIIPLLIARIAWDHHVVMVLPTFALFWTGKQLERMLALFAWLICALIGGFSVTLVLTLCWLVACWPDQADRIWQGMLQKFTTLEYLTNIIYRLVPDIKK